jgi:hypothetical protein
MSTKREKEAYYLMLSRLERMGFTWDEANQLRRISMRLSRWSEEECNGTIKRDGDDGEGKPRRYWQDGRGEIHPFKTEYGLRILLDALEACIVPAGEARGDE